MRDRRFVRLLLFLIYRRLRAGEDSRPPTGRNYPILLSRVQVHAALQGIQAAPQVRLPGAGTPL